MKTKSLWIAPILLIIGGGAGYLIAAGQNMDHSGMGMDQSAPRSTLSDTGGPCPGGTAPAYWVAPMDSQFRRDAPGKSPMGMALVPECANDANGSDVSVSSAVMQTLGVQTAVARRAQLTPVVRTVGTVGIDESTIKMIHTRAEGWLQSVNADAEGEAVEIGKPLYTLFAPKLVAAEREYLSAGSNRLLRDAARARLIALGYSNQQVQALARKGRASENLVVAAPQSGVLTMLGAREGQYVQPGTHLMTLADLSRVWVTVQVPERQARMVQKGQSATVAVEAFPNQEWDAIVDYVYPELDMNTRSVSIRLSVPNTDRRLQPGMFAAAVVSTASSDMTTVVPASAVIRTGGTGPLATRVVKSVAPGQFDVVPVTTGMRVGDEIEITSGLETDDLVVVAGQFLLDSEANVAAEAMRVSHDMSGDMAAMEMVSDGAPDSMAAMDGRKLGTATGTVMSVDTQKNKLVLDHGPFSPLGSDGLAMPSMTMGFSLSSTVSLEGIAPGDEVEVTVENPSRGVYQIVEIKLAGATDMDQRDTPMDDATMGHGAMDHSSMDHSSMDHGEMNGANAGDSPMHQSGMTRGTVIVVNADTGLLVLDHARIESLQMDAMTMGFAVASTIDLSVLAAGDVVMFAAEFAESGPNVGKFQVTAIHKVAAPQ